MSKSTAFARISLTLPPEVLAAADRLALVSDRSRSWVIAEAIRRLAGERGAIAGPQPATGGVLPARLRAEMVRSAEERVLAGEQRASASATRESDQLLSFRSYQAYLAWTRRSGARP